MACVYFEVSTVLYSLRIAQQWRVCFFEVLQSSISKKLLNKACVYFEVSTVLYSPKTLNNGVCVLKFLLSLSFS
jgi:hypothetical protein